MSEMVYNYIAPVGEQGRHIWTLKGPNGAIHVWAAEHSKDLASRFSERYYGGVETHSPTQLYGSDTQSSHENCWLLGGPCYHDGTSLYFSENIAPILPSKPPFSDGVVEYINAVMLNFYASNFGATP